MGDHTSSLNGGIGLEAVRRKDVRKLVNRLAIMGLIALPVVGAAVPAGASASPKTVRVGRVDSNPPNINIVGNGKLAVYSKRSLKVLEDDTNGCKTGFVSFTLTNTGTKTAFVTINGAPNQPIAAGVLSDYCESGAFPGYKLIFGLANKTNTVAYNAKMRVKMIN
jgi:hypothetical protein